MDIHDTPDTEDTLSPIVTFSCRLPEELVIRMDVLAARERKSRQRWIEEALELVVQRVEGRRDA